MIRCSKRSGKARGEFSPRSIPGLLMCGLLGLALVACDGGHSRGLDAILDAGELRVGISADLPPLNMKNRDGEFAGLEIDIVNALGAAMGLRVQFFEKQFSDLLPALEKGELDMVASALTITPERNARVAFVGPYFISGTSLLSKSETLASVADVKDLNLSDRTYVALEGSTNAKFVSEQLPEATLVTTADYEAAIELVMTGKADALIADFQVCNLAQWRNPDAELHTMMTPFTTEPLGIALPPDNPLLLNLVSNYLNTLENTGELAQLKAKWLADGSWLSELE